MQISIFITGKCIISLKNQNRFATYAVFHGAFVIVMGIEYNSMISFVWKICLRCALFKNGSNCPSTLQLDKIVTINWYFFLSRKYKLTRRANRMFIQQKCASYQKKPQTQYTNKKVSLSDKCEKIWRISYIDDMNLFFRHTRISFACQRIKFF